MSEEMEKCDNCLKMFPEAKIATHFGYCRRNIKRCDKCGEMYDINYADEHEEQFHKKVPCQHCKREFGSGDIEAHTKNCHHKPKFCQYCQQKVPPQQFNSHLAICESRTKMCEKCKQPISNKQFLIHMTTCQGMKVEQKKSPTNYQDYLQAQRNPEPKNAYFRNQQPKNQYAKVNFQYKPYGQRTDTQDYKKWLYKQDKKGHPYQKKETEPIKENSRYTAGDKKVMERNSRREQYGSSYQISGKIKNDPQIQRDDPQIRRDHGIKIPSYHPSTNPTGQYKLPNQQVTNSIGKINTGNYKPSPYTQNKDQSSLYSRGQPSYNTRDEPSYREKSKVYDYKREQIKIPSYNNIPSYNQPKARNTGISTEQTSYSGKNSESSRNPNAQSIPNSYQYNMANKRQLNKPEPKKVEKKQWRPEDYGGYIADDSFDLNSFQEENRPNISNNYHIPPPIDDSLQNEDAELQKAIMMSIGEKKSLKKPNNVPKQLQNLDQMSQSFYRDIDIEKQQALYEEAQKRKRKRY